MSFNAAGEDSVSDTKEKDVHVESFSDEYVLSEISDCFELKENVLLLPDELKNKPIKGNSDSVYSEEFLSEPIENDDSNFSNVNSVFTETLKDICDSVEVEESFINEDSNLCVKTLKKEPLAHKEKLKELLTSLINNDVEYQRKAAVSTYGLIDDEIRQKIWPALVGVDMFETSPRPSQDEIESHPYYNQVVLDVNRSISRFPPSIKEKQRLSMQDQLVFLIMRVLIKHPEFHYYQGYHDICVTFLLVLGEETAFHVVERLSVSHLNVFMEKSMVPTIKLLSYMFPIIGKERPELMNFLIKSDVGIAYCLSWLITWFGHVLNDYETVVRLFDFFIVSHSWMPMYLTTAIVLHQGSEVLNLDCDIACVHSFLAKISDELPFEDLILESRRLLKAYPQEELERDYVYLPLQNNYKRRSNRFIYSMISVVRKSVPNSKISYSLVIAAAVLLTAVLYQAYK